MSKLSRIPHIAKRLFSGTDIVMVKQSQDHWNRQFADGKWDRLVSAQPNTERIAELIRAHAAGKPIKVLDVGCGNGGLTHALAGTPDLTYMGTDISGKALEVAKAFIPEGTYEVTDAALPPTQTPDFDVLVFNEIFFYVDPRVVLPAYRMVNPDALVIISIVRTWRSLFLWPRVARFVKRAQGELIEGQHRWDVLSGFFKKP